MKYYWAQVSDCGYARCRYFRVVEGETLEDVVERHFPTYRKIVVQEEVTKEYAEANAKQILR